WTKASQREKRNIRDALRSEGINEGVVFPLRHVIEVLHANYVCNFLSFRELSRSNVAQTDMTNEPFTFEFIEYGQRLRDRSLRRLHNSANSKVHDVQSIQAEIS